MNSKKLIVIFFLLSLSLFASSLSREKITEMVNKIKVERSGIGLEILENTPNPFAIVEHKIIEDSGKKEAVVATVKKQTSYGLTAILNHRAFIDGAWYKIGDSLGTYKVKSIGKKRVVLKSGNESKELVIPRKEKKFKMFKGE